MGAKKSRLGVIVVSLRGIAINLHHKVKVVSRIAEQPVYPKQVGSRGCFCFDPTLVDKWVKLLIYKEAEVGSHGSSVTLVTHDPTPT